MPSEAEIARLLYTDENGEATTFEEVQLLDEPIPERIEPLRALAAGDDVEAKLLQVWATLFGGPPAAAAFVLSAAYHDDPQESLAILRDLAAHLSSPQALLDAGHVK